jgi:hypothetical protein
MEDGQEIEGFCFYTSRNMELEIGLLLLMEFRERLLSKYVPSHLSLNPERSVYMWLTLSV